jgi:hypothetical protein
MIDVAGIVAGAAAGFGLAGVASSYFPSGAHARRLAGGRLGGGAVDRDCRGFGAAGRRAWMWCRCYGLSRSALLHIS